MPSNDRLEQLLGDESRTLAEDAGTVFANRLILAAMERLPEDARQRCHDALAAGDAAAATAILTEAAIDLRALSAEVAGTMMREYERSLTDDTPHTDH